MDDREKGRQHITLGLHGKSNMAQELIDSAKFVGGVARLEGQLMLESTEFTAPVVKAMAKGIVDGIVDEGVDFRQMPGYNYKYGIPVTREEFDAKYAEGRKKGEDVAAQIASSAKIGTIEGLTELDAKHTAASLVMTLGPVTQEMASRGLDSRPFMELAVRKTLGPADIDLNALDSCLTADERGHIEKCAKEARFITENGLLQSTEKDAPSTSPWSERLKREAHDTAMAALQGAMKR